MVGKLSDDRYMSGSRLPVLYLWLVAKDSHPYSTPNDELRRSIEAVDGTLRDFQIGEPGICGNLLENVLVENACEELNIPEPVLSPPVVEYKKTFQVSLDGLSWVKDPLVVHPGGILSIEGDEPVTLSGPIPIECKVTSDYPTDEPPLYRGPIQLQAQMRAVDAEFGVLITLHRGIERRIRIYKANAEIQDQLVHLADDFKRRVYETEYYPPVTVDDAVQTHPEASGEIELPDLTDRIARLLELRETAQNFETEIKALEVEIMNEMQDAEIAYCNQYKVKWPVRNYKAQPEKITPAKEARTVRLKTLQITDTMS